MGGNNCQDGNDAAGDDVGCGLMYQETEELVKL